MGAMTYTIDDIERLLASGADRPVEIPDAHPGPSDEMPFTHLDHARQTAAVLRQWVPDDEELVVAGLVHDIGHLLPGVDDAAHPVAGARAVSAALGERIATLVGLHVEAKRYLVACQGAYSAQLAADSVASLALQGGPMSAEEQLAFEALPHAQDALTLRRADESGKVDGLVVPELGEWMDVMRQLSR
jgi:predicted HD phosphohydrolase